MSISSKRLQELTEEKIGEGQSKYVFGKYWEELYKVFSEDNDLSEEIFKEGLTRCEFKDPERIGLVAFLCPILCTYITDRILGRVMREFYRFIIYISYFIFMVVILQSLIEWKMSSSIPFIIVCMIITSWCFREWSRHWNNMELIYNVLLEEKVRRG